VFSGGFTLDAAEAVCSDETLGSDAVIGGLRGLVEKSLLERDTDDVEGRYRMLEVIRQFGSAKLDSAEITGWRRRHRDYYLAMAERFDAEWTGPDQRTWIQRFRQEHANLRLAFDLSSGDPAEAALAMRMAPVLEHYFASTGGGPEAVHWLQLMLAHGTGTPRERASALRIGVFIGSLIAALDVAAQMYDELVGLAEETGDDVIRGQQLYAGAALRTWQGDPAAGGQLAEQGIEVLHRLGDVPHEANLHFLHGMMLGWVDKPGEAAAAYQRCFELTEPRRERWLTSYSLWGLGVDAFMAGRLDEAIKLEREALEAKADFGDQLGIGLTLGALGWVAAEQGRGKDAALLLGATEAIWARIGMSVAAMPYLSRRREEGIERTRRLLGDEDFDALSERGGAMPQEEVIQLALGRPQSDAPSLLESLTRREREIADHLAVGMSNKEIAERLFISVRTVETHVENILRKLELQSRAQVPAAMRPG
jgi:non-specific serine/threonine protein kinase